MCKLPALVDVQRNLTKIEGNVRELEAKLKHEQDKFKTYNKDLKEAENRHVHRLASALSPVLFVTLCAQVQACLEHQRDSKMSLTLCSRTTFH